MWAPISTAEPLAYLAENTPNWSDCRFHRCSPVALTGRIPVDEAVDYVLDRYQALKQAYPDKRIVISEGGLAQQWSYRTGAVASRANQAKFSAPFSGATRARQARLLRDGGLRSAMEAWSRGDVGSHWGIYDEREPKFNSPRQWSLCQLVEPGGDRYRSVGPDPGADVSRQSRPVVQRARLSRWWPMRSPPSWSGCCTTLPSNT